MTPIQAALAALDFAEEGHEPELSVTTATAKALMVGYDRRWHDSAWSNVGAAEKEFFVPIVNPDSNRTSRTYTHGGKMDGIAEFEGKRFLREHKTCSEDIEDPDAPYWRRLDIDAQVSGYMLAHWQEGERLAGTLYDVIRKPGIRPKAISQAAAKEMQFQGTYCGFKVAEEDRIAAGEKETPRLFAMRLVRDTFDFPAWYFARKTIYRNDKDILEYARELWETADEIRLAKINDRHFRNSGACMNWGRPCEFLGICSGRDTADSDKWTKREQVHRELETITGDTRGILTNSRTSTFRTCRRKHYLRYEIGLERVDREEAESLYFGRLMHAALAAWWTALPSPQESSYEQHCQPAVIEAAGDSAATNAR